MPTKRDNAWLVKETQALWMQYFSDAKAKNSITIRFGCPARSRLGSIRLTKEKKSKILINGLFKDPAIPSDVIRGVICHELTHYIQGFGSDLPKLSRHPHRCSLVDKEIKKRGAGHLMEKQKKWINEHWEAITKKYFTQRKTQSVHLRKTSKYGKIKRLWRKTITIQKYILPLI